ncbi:DUF6270 domain-containing protein [Salinicoccus sp. HZC-1]|uniref:DUF6270 domain-containing protein n=1 Tax=Salinicoccus sp. HZC-1 TaxID=3385497 RepID=UPI00398AC17C
MKVDIIGSEMIKKLTEFKKFPYKINNFVSGQSLLSLISTPYPVDMVDLETDDIHIISTAFRDFNKSLFTSFKTSESEILILDLLSELNTVCQFNQGYFNQSSMELLKDTPDYTNLSHIEKFRAFQDNKEEIFSFLNKYEKIIIIKPDDLKGLDSDFLNALYEMIQKEFENHLVLTLPDPPEGKSYFNSPIEYYDPINFNLKKFTSDNYYNQMLFDEKLEENELSVFINHIEEREYVYELYKDGRSWEISEPTTSRFYKFTLKEKGNYRIRVNLTDESVNPRFSETYKFNPSSILEERLIEYVEMPDFSDMWMLDYVLEHENINAIVGNPFKYPEGYSGITIIQSNGIDEELILFKIELFEYVFRKMIDVNTSADIDDREIQPKQIFLKTMERYLSQKD